MKYSTLLAASLLIGCSGSTTDEVPVVVAPVVVEPVVVEPVTPVVVEPVTPAVPTFSLSKLHSTALGTVYSTKIAGSDSDDDDFTGSIYFANRAQEMRGGVLVTPRDWVERIDYPSYNPIISTYTTYVDASNNIIASVSPGNKSDFTCRVVSPNNIPATVKIGDFGNLSTRVCGTNTVEINWSIEDAGNGTISVITTQTYKDGYGEAYSKNVEALRIDGNGDIIAYRYIGTETDPYFKVTFESL